MKRMTWLAGLTCCLPLQRGMVGAPATAHAASRRHAVPVGCHGCLHACILDAERAFSPLYHPRSHVHCGLRSSTDTSARGGLHARTHGAERTYSMAPRLLTACTPLSLTERGLTRVLNMSCRREACTPASQMQRGLTPEQDNCTLPARLCHRQREDLRVC